MPDFSRAAILSIEQIAVEDDASADACSVVEINHVRLLVARAQHALCNSSGSSLALHQYRQFEFGFEAFPYRNVAPELDDGRGGDHAAPRVDKIEIVAAGLYKSTISGKVVKSDSASGTRAIVASEKLLKKTDQVVAKPGVEFGVRYRIVGAPTGKEVPIKIVTYYPLQGLYNPKTHQTTWREELDAKRPVGRVLYESFHFDHDWELVPGTWSFQFWYDGRLLAEQQFSVTLP